MSPEIRTDEEAWLDLRTYDQSWFDRGRSNPIILLWWLVQGILFPLSLHQMDSFRCAILRLFGAKIGLGVKIRPTVRVTYP